MPRAAPRFCTVPGCGVLVAGASRCAAHAAAEKAKAQAVDRERGTAAQRGYGAAWQKARAGFLRSHPLCVHCKTRGLVTAATDVDHINGADDHSMENLRSLCSPHHDHRSAQQGARARWARVKNSMARPKGKHPGLL